jgi:hypothetical protein
VSALPGDGSEQAKADEETEGDDQQDGPRVGGKLEGWAGARAGHDGVSFGEGAMHTEKCVGAIARNFLEKR